MEDVVAFTSELFGRKPAPLKLTRETVDVLFTSMVEDGILSPQHRLRLISALPYLMNRDGVTLTLLESLAPDPTYLVFRWLRSFFTEELDRGGAVYSLIPEIPLTSTIPVIYTHHLADRLAKVVVDERLLNSRFINRLRSVCERLSVDLEVQTLSPVLKRESVCHQVKDEGDLLAALGELREEALDILSEVLASGGVATLQSILNILTRRHRRCLKLLIAFDFLRLRPTQAGLAIYLTRKSLEVLV